MVIAEVSIVPVGEGASVSSYVKKALEALSESGLKVVPGAMSTIIEAGNLEEVFSAVKAAHEAVINSGASRVLTSIKIDDRRDKEVTIESKLRAIS